MLFSEIQICEMTVLEKGCCNRISLFAHFLLHQNPTLSEKMPHNVCPILGHDLNLLELHSSFFSTQTHSYSSTGWLVLFLNYFIKMSLKPQFVSFHLGCSISVFFILIPSFWNQWNRFQESILILTIKLKKGRQSEIVK